MKWVRIRAKALWLAFRMWRVTRELRATAQRIRDSRNEPPYKISDQELEQVIQQHRRLVVGVTVPEGKSEGR